jgi:voltage-gated potassium channel
VALAEEVEPMTGVGRKVREFSVPQNVVERRMTKFMHEPPSVRTAASVIVTATVSVVVLGGVLMRVLDHAEYSSVWVGMWWVLETVTTVGFGDLTPTSAVGRILTSIVMLWGIAFLAIVTAAITSVFVARAEQERTLDLDAAAGDAVQTADDRLEGINAQLIELAASTRRLDERVQQIQESLERRDAER